MLVLNLPFKALMFLTLMRPSLVWFLVLWLKLVKDFLKVRCRLALLPFLIIPKHLFQGYLNIYNNYFKAPWMPDRTEANPNELNQDDARYGFRCCHLKNIWTAPLPPETELSRQMTTSTTSIDIMGLQAA